MPKTAAQEYAANAIAAGFPSPLEDVLAVKARPDLKGWYLLCRDHEGEYLVSTFYKDDDYGQPISEGKRYKVQAFFDKLA